MTPYYEDDAVTIYHGDCREVTEWLTADVLVTDPPYGMNFRSGMGGKFGTCEVLADDSITLRSFALTAWGLRPALVFGRWSIPHPVNTRAVLTWEKGMHIGMGDLRLPWKPNTEEVYVLGEGFTGHRGSSVLKFNAILGQGGMDTRDHPVQKPLGLLRALIDKCPPGVIADPFMGSGTTLRAAKDLGRRAIGVEVEERYCEVAAHRAAQEVLFG